jgi:hypothetical protein
MHVLPAWYDHNNPRSFVARIRRRRLPILRDVIDRVFHDCGRVRILDLGGRRAYWRPFGDAYLNERNVSVVLLNDRREVGPVDPGDHLFATAVGDACDLSEFQDKSFDLVHSNSVIEHVGSWPRMEAFARNVRRLGSAYFVQTPYFWFPFEPHFTLPFFHWLPEGWRIRILMSVNLPAHPRSPDVSVAMWRIERVHLLDKMQFQSLFPDAKIKIEWLGPFPKSLKAISPRGKA